MISEIEGIDKIDKKILYTIENDARLSYSEIGEKVGLSRVAVKNRIEVLENKGIIQGYYTKINPTADPQGIKFFIDIEADPTKYDNVIGKLAMFKSIRQLYTSTGESRIHAIGFAPDNGTLHKYVHQIFGKLDGVNRLICHTILVTHKDVDGGIYYESGSSVSENQIDNE